MKTCTLVLKDWVNASFENLDPSTRRACNKELKFFIHAARHTPAYKLGRWDGTTSYFAINGNTYINLLERTIPIITKAGYEIEINDQRQDYGELVFEPINDNYLSSHMGNPVWPKGHPHEGEPIKLREHQIEAINKFLENTQGIAELCTSFGKTLVTAVLSHNLEKYGRSLVIVPNKDLVKQTEEDYRLCGLDVGVYFGDRKELGKTHTICTWQSLDRLIKKPAENKEILDSIKENLIGIIVDEAHISKSTVLTKLLCQTFASVPIRWGMTGTMPREDHEACALLAGIGPLIHQLGARELMDKDILSSCHIHCLQMIDTVEYVNFHDEHEFLVKDHTRLEWVAELLKKLRKEGNTLILVDRVDTGKILETLVEDFTFVYGGTKSDDRKETYSSFSDNDNLLLGASYGVAAVGINLPRIFNLVLFEPGKSDIRVIQSIGRGIRRAKDKDFVEIYDISSTCKFSKRHLNGRLKTYQRVDYPYTKKKVDYRVQLQNGSIDIGE